MHTCAHVFSVELGERFITGREEGWNKGRLVHKSASFLHYDPRTDKFRRKEIYSYGFVNNEVEYAGIDKEIRFKVVVEPSPKQFEGMRLRSCMRKISDSKIAMGLERAEGKEEFERFGETIAEREM